MFRFIPWPSFSLRNLEEIPYEKQTRLENEAIGYLMVDGGDIPLFNVHNNLMIFRRKVFNIEQ